ncbi:MAG: EthD family reductase [Pseudomonadota bacterium]
MTTLVVTYPAKDGAAFDADYYTTTHIPLVREKWTQHGLTRARALMPEEVAPAYLAVAILDFADGAALDRSLASAEAADVFGDVAKFTDIAAVPLRCEDR